jgi:indole-3-glycerol phosphate synthase
MGVFERNLGTLNVNVNNTADILKMIQDAKRTAGTTNENPNKLAGKL